MDGAGRQCRVKHFAIGQGTVRNFLRGNCTERTSTNIFPSKGPQALPSVEPTPKSYPYWIPDGPDQPGRQIGFRLEITYLGLSVENNSVGSTLGSVYAPLPRVPKLLPRRIRAVATPSLTWKNEVTRAYTPTGMPLRWRWRMGRQRRYMPLRCEK